MASGFFVKTGSRDEVAKVAGVSHFLEHMVFKGRSRDLAVNRDFDRVGAKHNAQTSEEDTFYHVTCLPEYLPRAFDVLSDILRPSLRDDDFETEKKVIVEEIRMYLDNPMMVAYEAAKAAHFGEHPLGRVSWAARVDLRPAVDAMRVLRRRYSPRNIVLAFAGNIGWDGRSTWPEALRLVEGRGATRHATPPRARARSRRSSAPRTSSRRSSASPTARRSRAMTATPRSCWPRAGGSHGVEALLGPDRPRPRRRRRPLVPGLQPGGRFFTFLSCEPDEAQANLARLADAYRARPWPGSPRTSCRRPRTRSSPAPSSAASGRWAASGRSASSGPIATSISPSPMSSRPTPASRSPTSAASRPSGRSCP